MKEIISEIISYNAFEVSEKIAHCDLAWNYLQDGEEIPYETVFFLRPTNSKDLTKKELQWAENVIEEFEASLKGKSD